MFLRRHGSLLLRTTGLGATYYTAIHHRTTFLGASSTTAYCDDTGAGGPKKRTFTSRKEKNAVVRTAVDDLATLPPLSLNKALDDIKEAQKAMGGTLKGDEALALMALLVRELLQAGSSPPQSSSSSPHNLSLMLVSPPLSTMRTRQRCQRLLEYATLCNNVYDMPNDKDWLKPPQEMGPVERWELLSSHPGGLLIPAFKVVLVDGGIGTRGRRRTKRLLVIVRGTADVSDAAINIAMVPTTWVHRGCGYTCHRGIVESSVFLVQMVRAVIWRAIDELKQQGVDPSDQLEVCFTGHSLGGATAAVAALQLQGEFGVRVPVRSVGFSTPASLSEDLAASPLTRRVCTTVVFGDDMIPRCSTHNLRELKRRAASVLVEEEVQLIKRMVTDEVTRRGDEWTKQFSSMLLAKASEARQQLPTAIDKILPPLPMGDSVVGMDVEALKKALGGVLVNLMPSTMQQESTTSIDASTPPATGADTTETSEQQLKAAMELALKDYQSALDAEIEFAKGQLERIKREALEPFSPVMVVPPSPPSQPRKRPDNIMNDAQKEEEEQDEEDDEAEEEALLAANAGMAAQRKSQLMNVAAIQAMLQKLIVEKANVAASAVKTQVEARVNDLLASIRADEVKGKAAGTVKWVKDSFKDLQAQAKAALPTPGRTKQQQQDVGVDRGDEVMVMEGVQEEAKDDGTIALYPPGEVFFIHPVPDVAQGTQKGPEYELRRVRDVHFFDGIVISPRMFTDHLMVSTIRGLQALSEDNNRPKKRM